jgi:DNA-directed RNA polymerase subunit F
VLSFFLSYFLPYVLVHYRTHNLFIGSLCCETAEEAKTLIPSLTDKISDEDLQELLDEVNKLMPN